MHHDRIGSSKDFSHIIERFDEGFHPFIDAGHGWSGVINDCHKKLLSVDPDYKVVQIKEKFGGLRYYFNPSNPVHTRVMSDIVRPFEKKSYTVCEVCGKNAKLMKRIRDSWLKTLCREHADSDMYEEAASNASDFSNKDKFRQILSLYPIVIRESRYSGVYEGGEWHAIPECNSDTWSIEYFEYLHGDDNDATNFWWNSGKSEKIGIGKTPNDALADLFKKNFI